MAVGCNCPSTSTDMGRKVRICAAASVPAGGVRQVQIAELAEPLAVFRINDRFHVTEDTCTHGFASLSQGDVVGDVIHCPLHGGAFKITTGEPAEYPCTIALKVFSVYQEGDDLYTDLAE